jgi:PAS domain S-box-containing protein
MRDRLKALLKRPLARYCAGITAVVLAFILREVLARVTGPDFPEYVLFYPTVMVVALLAGLWPAVAAIATVALLILLFWFLPGHMLPLFAGPVNPFGFLLFLVVGIFLSLVAELYRSSRAKAAAYDKEQSLRESQEAIRRQAELLKLSFDSIIVRRMSGEIESWNRGAEELYGYTESEALGRDVTELLRSDLGIPRAQFESLLRERGQWDGEIRHVTKDGRAVIVSSRQHIGGGPDGLERVLKIDRDITDQKRAQAELLRAHEELEAKVQERTADLSRANRMLTMVGACDQALVENTDERELMAVICQIIQEKGGYPFVWVGVMDGPGAEPRHAASAGERRRPLAPSADIELAARAVAAGLPALSGADGTADPARTAAFPLLSLQKTGFGALVIHASDAAGFTDDEVTLLKELVDDLAFGITSLRARAERDQAQRSLEQKAAQLRALAGEIVRTEQKERTRIAQLLHDNLQQLLAAALYGTEGLRTASSAAGVAEEAGRVGGLLRECIAMSRSLTTELSHPSLSEPDLGVALDWLASWMKERHGLEVEVAVPRPITMEAEETRVMLMQAARELLFNVVKHSGVKRARVDASRMEDGGVRVTVGDQGAGFDADRIGGMAGPVESIGLFSIRERLAAAGGGMKVDTAPGRGTRISVWVPPEPARGPAAAPAEAAAVREAPPASARGPGGGRIRVLLVDDHAVVREGLAAQLRQQPDIEIVGEASTGEEAVRRARELSPDVVTMDVHMPGMGGIATTRLLRAELPDVAVVGLSMYDEPKQAAAMREAGAVDYLSKSASVDALLASIRGAVGVTRRG